MSEGGLHVYAKSRAFELLLRCSSHITCPVAHMLSNSRHQIAYLSKSTNQNFVLRRDAMHALCESIQLLSVSVMFVVRVAVAKARAGPGLDSQEVQHTNISGVRTKVHVML
jgi:hypothetical protein